MHVKHNHWKVTMFIAIQERLVWMRVDAEPEGTLTRGAGYLYNLTASTACLKTTREQGTDTQRIRDSD